MIRALLIGLVRAYRFVLSPWLGRQCRFYPTCSQYALDALGQHGAARGALMAAARILRCNPWNWGGVDEVPEQFTWRCLCGAGPRKPGDEGKTWNCNARSLG